MTSLMNKIQNCCEIYFFRYKFFFSHEIGVAAEGVDTGCLMVNEVVSAMPQIAEIHCNEERSMLGGKNATKTTYTWNRSGDSYRGPVENFKGKLRLHFLKCLQNRTTCTIQISLIKILELFNSF